VGERIVLDGAGESALILRERTPNGHWFAHPLPDQSLEAVLERHGQVPLPPYIRRSRSEPGDRDDYQTVFARRPGAVAAPTAGLHFTPELLGRLQHKGVELVWLTLHVGPGTFQPIRESLESHVMHSEWGELGPEAARRIERRRRLGGRTVAVGTTSVRLLETVAPHGLVQAWSGETALFIHSPYTFRVVDAMMTNFHLPRSTLLALVYAFAGEEFGRRAYAAAVQQRYRFYSFGDAMLIL
jgi:S-adenosylmethionine:tRNA ribosyltransferase-isomerase